jgi:outer membrane protein, heavy metal efflux system
MTRESAIRVVRRIWLTLILSFPAIATAQTDQAPDTDARARDDIVELSLHEAVETVVADNPGLAEIRARADALAAIPSQVGALPDPRVSFNALNLPTDTFDLGQEPMTQMQFGISQAVPFPGKLKLREEIAEHVFDAATNDVDELRVRLVAEVKRSWWQLAYLKEALKIVDQNEALMREFVRIASIKYEVGKGLQQDVLLAQLELSKLTDLQLQLEGAQGVENSRIIALLDWPVRLRVVLPDKLQRTFPVPLPAAELHARADLERPVLAARDNQIKAAKSAVDLAKRDIYPDFDFGGAYGIRSGENPITGDRADFLTLRMTLNVPIFAERKQLKAIDQRQSEAMERVYALADTRAQVGAEIAAALADFERAKRQTELFETGIIPQARQTVASMLGAYQVNEVDFLNLVGAEITLYNYEVLYWRALADANRLLAELEAAVGTEDIYVK